MISVSDEWKKYFYEYRSHLLVRGILTTASGHVYYLDYEDSDDDFIEMSLADAVSNESSFDVGNFVLNTCTFKLNNSDRKWKNILLENAKLEPYVGFQHPRLNYALASGNYNTDSDTNAWIASTTAFSSYYTITAYDGYIRLYCKTATSTAYYAYLTLTDDFDSSTEYYTVTFKVRTSASKAINVYAKRENSSGNSSYVQVGTISAREVTANTWVEYSVTFSPDENYTYTGIGFSMGTFNASGNYLDIEYLIVEQGEEFTEYNRAREDFTENGVEWVKKGTFYISDTGKRGSRISLTAYDNTNAFETSFSGVSITYPITIANFVKKICDYVGVTLATTTFTNSTYSISTAPNTSSTDYTCRQMISYAAMLAGCYARCNVDGELELKWYDNATNIHTIPAYSSFDNNESDTEITGVKVIAMASENVDSSTDEDSSESTSDEYTYGSDDDYLITIQENPLIPYGSAETVAKLIGTQIVGTTFRSSEISALYDPSMEAGDTVQTENEDGDTVTFYAANISVTLGSYATIKCSSDEDNSSSGSTSVLSYIMGQTADLVNAKFENFITKNLSAEVANIGYLTADEISATYIATDELQAKVAEFGYVMADEIDATVANFVTLKTSLIYSAIADLGYVSTDTLDASVANILKLTTSELYAAVADLGYVTADTVSTNYLRADFANLTLANAETFFATVGILTDMTVGDASITGTLTGVTIYGDCIVANSIVAESLVLKGEDGLYYAINATSDSLTTSELADEKYQQYIDGSVLVAQSITATQIAAGTITANEIAAQTITGNEIAALSITADKLSVNTLSAITADLGAVTAGSITIVDNDGTIIFLADMDTKQLIINTTGLTLDADGNATFSGILNAASGSFSGKITAESGTIGGFSITGTSIYRTYSTYGASGGIYFGTSGLSIGGTFKVSNGGALTCTSGTIGGWTIGNNALYNGTSYLYDDTDGIYLGTDGIASVNDGDVLTIAYGIADFESLYDSRTVSISSRSISLHSVGSSDEFAASSIIFSYNGSTRFSVYADSTGLIADDGKITSYYTNIAYAQERDDTGFGVSFGIGSGGYNRGVYDITTSTWMLYKNESDVVYLQNTQSTINIITEGRLLVRPYTALTTDNTGYLFAVQRTASSALATTTTDSVIFCAGTDDTSPFIRSYPTYARTATGSANVHITSGGTFTTYSSSASRYKNTINYFSNLDYASAEGLAKRDYTVEESDYRDDYRVILKFPVVQFHYNTGYMTGEPDYDYTKYVTGFIAEDIAALCPACATYTEDGQIEAWNHMEMIPRMVACIQDIYTDITLIDDRVTILEAQLAEAQLEIVNLKKQLQASV